jgi:hypothetical protein
VLCAALVASLALAGSALAAPTYQFVTAWGSTGSGNGQFTDPEGVTLDSSGNVYVADSGNNRIQKFTSAGVYTTQFGGLSLPFDMVAKSSGNILVANRLGYNIVELDSGGNYVNSFSCGDYESVDLDSGENLWATDDITGCGVPPPRVVEFNSSGSEIGGWSLPSGTGFLAIGPSGNIYVTLFQLDEVREYTPAGALVNTFGTSGSGPGQLDGPGRLSIDSSGNLYIPEANNDRVSVFDSGGSFITSFGTSGSGNGELSGPKATVVDSTGNVYVVDKGNNRIEEFSAADTTPPDTTIDAHPSDPTNSSSAHFEFSGDDGGGSGVDHFECQLDSGGWSTCTSPDDFTVGDGTHTFEVRAVDAANNTDTTPDSFTWTVDTQNPIAVIDAHPNDPTNDTSAHFTFHATDPSPSSGIDHFECELDGGGFSNCSSPDDFTVGEGQHTFRVKVFDSASNQDPTPTSFTWIVDTTPPDITITKPANRERFLLDQNVTPVYNCDDPTSGGVNTGPPSCDDNGFSTEVLGPHLFTVTSTDGAGNTSTKTHAYVIDPPRYGDFVQDDDPVAYYRFNEPYPSAQDPQSITMVDSSGHGHDGTYKNDVVPGRTGAIACERRPHPPRACELASDPENRAASFPERDGYGYVNGISASTSGYTMEAWVKPRDSNDMMVMSHGRAGQLWISGGRLAFQQSQDNVYSSGPDSAVPPNQWSFVSATWDRSSGRTYLYVNGHQVGSSDTANKEPSGTSTFYVGYGEMAPWFHGEIDEAALYDHALSHDAFEDRYEIGTAKDNPSIEAGNSPLNTEGPMTDPVAPKNGGLYAPHKTPNANFSCTDPDDVPGNSDVASCTAVVADGNPDCTTLVNPAPITSGQALRDSLGVHCFIVSATDEGGNTYVHTHTYTVKPYSSIVGYDNPIAYYRLGDGAGATTMVDASPNHRDGEYKNNQDSGPVGISGDGDTARDFHGDGGYGFVNGLTAPTYQMTLEAWVDPRDPNRDQSIAGHGDGGELYLENGVFKFRHGPQNRVVSSGVGPGPNPFTQVVGVWDGVNLMIYVDGQLKGTTESNRRPSSVSTFYVGFGEVKPWFDGAIDEVAYYDVALNNNRVFQHFLADPPPGNSAPQDTTPPETTITSGPAKSASVRNISFAFRSSEPGSSFKCSLDGAAFKTCASPFKAKVAVGAHKFKVRARDAAGNTDRTPAHAKFTVVPKS